MPNKILWDAPWTSRGTVLSTQLNALANAGLSAAAVFDNTVNLEQFFMAEFVSGASWTPGAGGYLEIYAVPSADGTNFGYGDATRVPAMHLVATIELPNAAGAWRQLSRIFTLGPGKYNVIVKNASGAALPASGNVLSLVACSDEVQ